jgi:predicted nucleotidyltransferase
VTHTASQLGTTEEKLREVVRRIASRFDPERIILFGSRARGDAVEDSDADLLVVMRVEGSRRQAALAVDFALLSIDLAVDLFVIRPEEFERDRNLVGTLAWPAANEGKVLYERPA